VLWLIKPCAPCADLAGPGGVACADWTGSGGACVFCAALAMTGPVSMHPIFADALWCMHLIPNAQVCSLLMRHVPTVRSMRMHLIPALGSMRMLHLIPLVRSMCMHMIWRIGMKTLLPVWWYTTGLGSGLHAPYPGNRHDIWECCICPVSLHDQGRGRMVSSW